MIAPFLLPKIVQLVAVSVPENSITQCEALIYALDEDGHIIMTNNREIEKGIWHLVDTPVEVER